MPEKTQYEKMLAGELYDASDPELFKMREQARSFIHGYNQSPYDKTLRSVLLKKIIGKMGEDIDIQTPFSFDYGKHIELGDHFFANFNCVFLDCNFIKIGDYVSLGPNVQIYAAFHPVSASERIKGPELASPVSIGNNVWVGGGSIICAGVNIGENSTIGAGSVVIRDIPSGVVAAGNPCRVLRKIP
jgi:maltose O-acetyltransferase